MAYAHKTRMYSNWNVFRTNGTDMYVMLHALFGKGSIIQFADKKNSDIFYC